MGNTVRCERERGREGEGGRGRGRERKREGGRRRRRGGEGRGGGEEIERDGGRAGGRHRDREGETEGGGEGGRGWARETQSPWARETEGGRESIRVCVRACVRELARARAVAAVACAGSGALNAGQAALLPSPPSLSVLYYIMLCYIMVSNCDAQDRRSGPPRGGLVQHRPAPARARARNIIYYII